MNSGWECPRCHKINAPSVLSCSCNGNTLSWPTTFPVGGWTCYNCKSWVPYGVTHICYWPVGTSGGTGGASSA